MFSPALCLALMGILTPALTAPTVTPLPGWCSGLKNDNMMSTMSTGCQRGNYRPMMSSGAMPQAAASPYTIQVDSRSGSTYTTGQNVSVIIKTTSANAKPFKAYFIRGDCSEATFAGELNCLNGQETTFCYTNGSTNVDCSPKYRVECVWTPPAYSIGQVQFQATIVQDDATYWTGVLSANVLDAASSMISYQQNARNIMAEQMRKFNEMKQKAQQMMGSFKPGNMQQNMQQMMNMMKNMQQTQQGNSKQNNKSAAMQKFMQMFQKKAQPTPTAAPQTAMQKMMAMIKKSQQQQNQQSGQAQAMRQAMQAFGRQGQGNHNQWHFGGNGEAAEAQENTGASWGWSG